MLKHRRNKTGQATNNCPPGWQGRTFYRNQILLQHSLQSTPLSLSRSGTSSSLSELSEEIFRQTDSSKLEHVRCETPFVASHWLVTRSVRDQSFLSRMSNHIHLIAGLYIVFCLELSNIGAPIFMTQEWQCQCVWAKPVHVVEKFPSCVGLMFVRLIMIKCGPFEPLVHETKSGQASILEKLSSVCFRECFEIKTWRRDCKGWRLVGQASTHRLCFCHNLRRLVAQCFCVSIGKIYLLKLNSPLLQFLDPSSSLPGHLGPPWHFFSQELEWRLVPHLQTRSWKKDLLIIIIPFNV